MAAFGNVIENSFSITLTTLPTAGAPVWAAEGDVLPPSLDPPHPAKAKAKTAMTDTRQPFARVVSLIEFAPFTSTHTKTGQTKARFRTWPIAFGSPRHRHGCSGRMTTPTLW